jgi:hypothetical protein
VTPFYGGSAARRGGKRQGGPARCRVAVGEEWRGRGWGAAPCEPARHGRGGSRPFGQWRAAHVARPGEAACMTRGSG